MKKYNLPVIVLNGLVLLPQNSIKLEYSASVKENNVIDMSELFHDKHLLISNKEVEDIGVLGKLVNKIELPNGNIRIDIMGLKRVKIVEYIKNSNPLESIVNNVIEEVDKEKEKILLEKLFKELKSFIKNVPYISNSVIDNLQTIDSLSAFIDSVVPNLNTSHSRILDYLKETDVINRSEMLLKDIYEEKEKFEIERNLDLRIKREFDDTQREYILREKMNKIKEELGETSSKDNEIDNLRKRIQNLKCPKNVREKLNFELRRYEDMNINSPEIGVIRDYIEWLLVLPWNNFTKENEDLKNVRKKLDETHYGLDDVKTRIIEYLAVKKNTKSLKGPIICLVGPPGTGKTSLVKEIAEAINRKYVKISVNGIRDVAEISGHRRTYIGANPGRIISALKKANSTNPLLLIDEIDKMSQEYNGDPTSSLLNILDPEQNKYFSDNYIEEDYDLSNVLFMLTANDIENIKEPLRDRLEIITLSGYTEFEKLDIAKKHLIPKIMKENGLANINFSDDIILEIIRCYTKEAGVRELQRLISKIMRKIVTQLVVNNIKMNKVNIDHKSLELYLGPHKYEHNKINKAAIGVVNGLAYTIYGGDILPIEANYFKGESKLILTGNLGEVMKESATIALSYIKSNYKLFNIDYDKLNNNIHIHVPEGAIPKDGPSAGIALTLSLISALTNLKIPSNLALTGEITLRGNILAIGGLKEKSIGALRSGITKIIMPFDNLKDLDKIPNEVKEKITFIPVKNFKDVLKEVSNEPRTN